MMHGLMSETMLPHVNGDNGSQYRVCMVNKEHKKNILIIKPGAIGDLLQLTPVIRALAGRYPGARISLLVGSRATATLFQHNPHVSDVIIFDKRGEHRSFSALLSLWKMLRAGEYGLVLNFQRSNLKAWFLATAAFPCRVLVYRKARNRIVHVVDNYLETIAPLDIAGQDRSLELFTGTDDEQFAEDVFSANGYGGKIVIALNPGASHPMKRWDTDQFAALGDELMGRLDARIVIIGGNDDIALASHIAASMALKPLVLTGKVTLLQVGAILKKCNLLVSGDTGPLHLATAVGTRVVGLFGAVDPARTGPVGTGHRVIQARGVECVPCRRNACNAGQRHACMKKILVKDVADAVVEMVAEKCSTPAISGDSEQALKKEQGGSHNRSIMV
jgi:heptosyltransferase II